MWYILECFEDFVSLNYEICESKEKFECGIAYRILVSTKVKEVYTYALACHESWQLPEMPTVCWQCPPCRQGFLHQCPRLLLSVFGPFLVLVRAPVSARSRTFYWVWESVGYRTLAESPPALGNYFCFCNVLLAKLVNPSSASSSGMSFCLADICCFVFYVLSSLFCYLIICIAFMKSSWLNLHTPGSGAHERDCLSLLLPLVRESAIFSFYSTKSNHSPENVCFNLFGALFGKANRSSQPG